MIFKGLLLMQKKKKVKLGFFVGYLQYVFSLKKYIYKLLNLQFD